MPANVRCSAIPNLPTASLDVHAFYHVERLTQSFPSRHGLRESGSLTVAQGRREPRGPRERLALARSSSLSHRKIRFHAWFFERRDSDGGASPMNLLEVWRWVDGGSWGTPSP